MTGAHRILCRLHAVLPSTLLVACSSGAAATSNRSPDGGFRGVDGGPQDSGFASVAPDAGDHPSPQSPPPVIDGCPSPGSPPANVGVWEDISPPEFRTPSTMETLTVAVDPVHPNVVYATAGNVTNGGHQGTGVMKSVDCGKSWTKISTGRNASHFDGGDLWAIEIDWSDPNVMYVTNGYGTEPSVYKSTNGGVDWDDVFAPDGAVVHTVGPPLFTQDVAMDPADSRHLVVSFHENCTGNYAPSCLAETKDAGATWRLFKAPTSGWQESANFTILGTMSFLLASPSGVFFTSDAGQSWTKVINDAAYGSYDHGAYLGPNGTLYMGAGSGVYASDPHAGTGPIGSAWTKMANSPHGNAIVSDGVHLFVGDGIYQGANVYRAPLSDLTTWTKMPFAGTRSATRFEYDPTRHVIYSANWGAGLWRLVTQ